MAGIAGYALGNHVPGYELPWEMRNNCFAYPVNAAKPLQVIIDASNGASVCGDGFGEPSLCGWTRSFGHGMSDSGGRFGHVKPIMWSRGLEQMEHLPKLRDCFGLRP